MLGWLLNLGFAGSGGASIWSDASTNTSSWTSINPVSAVWDAGASQWDLVGNVYNSVWDGQDDTWNDASTNAVSYSDE